MVVEELVAGEDKYFEFFGCNYFAIEDGLAVVKGFVLTVPPGLFLFRTHEYNLSFATNTANIIYSFAQSASFKLVTRLIVFAHFSSPHLSQSGVGLLCYFLVGVVCLLYQVFAFW